MKRIFDAFAYGEGPRSGCWWDETVPSVKRPVFEKAARTDVAIIGAGFTGLSAALHLARAGISVTVLEAERVGWGASGRNGGFCCLGGGMVGDAALDRRFGVEGRVDFRRTELAAVNLVEKVVQENGIDVDRHSNGETVLAHRAKDMHALKGDAATLHQNYGIGHKLHEKEELTALGMNGPFHGALTIKAGFGLNPRKYCLGLAEAAERAGAKIFETSAVSKLESEVSGWRLRSNGHALHADQVIVATNGYSSEDVPPWLAGRYMPGQSNVIVTRPLSDEELAAAGWTTDQMAYDTRHLLHYFRLMPDRRFLFGMRGGLMTGAAAEARAAVKIRADFERMFPAWKGVATTHNWSGMVCIARDMLPYVGAVPEQPGLWASMCYHGNGVAMGSYGGALLAQLVQGRKADMLYPDAMRVPLRRFELGPLRRAAMPFAYAGLMFADR